MIGRDWFPMRRLLLVLVVGCGSSKEPAPSTSPAAAPAKDATIAIATIDGATTEQVADEPVLGNLDGAHAFCNMPADGLCIEWPPGRHAEEKKSCEGTWSTTSGCPSAGVLGLCINTEVPAAGRRWLYSSRFASIEAAHEKGMCWDRGDVFTPGPGK
jgi:hypothetical protein